MPICGSLLPCENLRLLVRAQGSGGVGALYGSDFREYRSRTSAREDRYWQTNGVCNHVAKLQLVREHGLRVMFGS